MLYIGHLCAWMCLVVGRVFVTGGSVRLFDALVISCMMAIFSSLAHALIFGG